ncbi:TetR/AcrR family transcriptional regulator [Yinghuangia sp. ASG 101]|uniref:TetR/AcrR family transcriptional regulator n=1 Tax=Yinghuangia sp. ASG 101 TaxID=2896848 RepID=UPI001E5923B5|nr:TetR/AcrR family transcriptional regulator [Yinghuangia sp. ASG 101]UGQ12765.1 TetR/AcrR family transcriptional regulator [Yinghuangia sp. ASG 101]
MTAPRRHGTEKSKTRFVLLDVAERLMLEEGYAAVGVRRVAREAGVAPALVLYHFGTLDDLFLALLRRRADDETARHARILDSPEPLRALWDLSSQPGTALIMEFMALANHRKAIRAEIAEAAERYRRLQLEALTRRVAEDGIDLDGLPPVAVTVLTAAISRTLMLESGLGMTFGHEETLALVESILRRSAAPPPADARVPAPTDHTADGPYRAASLPQGKP